MFSYNEEWGMLSLNELGQPVTSWSKFGHDASNIELCSHLNVRQLELKAISEENPDNPRGLFHVNL